MKHTYSILFIVTLYMPVVYAQKALENLTAQQETTSDSCTIPPETEIVHIPAKNWYIGADTLKTVQETIDVLKKGAGDTIQFFERQWADIVNGENTKEQNIDDEKKKASSILEEVAYSQFILAKLIQNNPNSFVFHEFTTQIYDSRYLNTLKTQEAHSSTVGDTQQTSEDNNNPEYLFQLVTQQFPNGLADEYTSLNETQKYTLAIVGGAHTLLFMNQLPIIFPFISDTDYKKLYQSDCKSHYNIYRICYLQPTYALRVYRMEKLAWTVNHFLTGNSIVADDKKAIAILVYNDDHDLKNYFPNKNFYKIPSRCLSIESNQ